LPRLRSVRESPLVGRNQCGVMGMAAEDAAQTPDGQIDMFDGMIGFSY
jgi:hypothetical protein